MSGLLHDVRTCFGGTGGVFGACFCEIVLENNDISAFGLTSDLVCATIGKKLRWKEVV